MSLMLHNKQQTGITFIEIVMSILIISIALTSVFNVLTTLYQSYQTSFLQQESRRIAQYHLDKILNANQCLKYCHQSIKSHRLCQYIQNKSIITDDYGKKIDDFKNYQMEIQLSPIALNHNDAQLVRVIIYHNNQIQLVMSAIKVDMDEV